MFHYLKTLFSYRYLLYNLTVKDLKVRYKTAILGFAWVILNPLVLMVILSVVFTMIIKIGIEKFPVFLLCGLLPWTFTSLSLLSVTTSIVDNSNLIKKVAFPRILIPFSTILANMVHFLLSVIVLFIFLALYKVQLTFYAMLFPLIVVIQFFFVAGISLIASVLHTWYRDVKYIIELLLLSWFYFTPIFYSPALVPDKLRKIYMLNPMACIVSMYRDILLYGKNLDLKFFGYTALAAIISFTIGVAAFRKSEKTFADVV